MSYVFTFDIWEVRIMSYYLFPLLFHEADPQSRPVVITIFARFVCTSVRPSPLFKISQNKTKQKVQARIVIATGGTLGLGEWIIYVTHVLCNLH